MGLVVISLTDKDNSSDKKHKQTEDPLEELNELGDKFESIEREKDPFDELELDDSSDIPEYDSKSGILDVEPSIIKSEEEQKKQEEQQKKEEEKIKPVLDVIQELATEESYEDSVLDKEENFNLKDELELSTPSSIANEEIPNAYTDSTQDDVVKKSETKTPETSTPKTASDNKIGQANSQKSTKTGDTKSKITQKGTIKPRPRRSNTKVIDNVKVDENGVPLLNQFDTDKIKDTYNRFGISKHSLTQILMIVVGVIITIVGILQALNDVVKISDHVMYGEHESFAIAIIFIGVLIIILAFYRQIYNLLGLNALTKPEDINSMPRNTKPRNKKARKKGKKIKK